MLNRLFWLVGVTLLSPIFLISSFEKSVWASPLNDLRQQNGPTFTLSTNLGTAGSTVAVTGCDWTKGELINFYVNQPEELIGKANVVLAGNCFEDIIVIPFSAVPGNITIEARGASGTTRTQPFTVTARELIISPDFGPPGSPFVAEGCNWIDSQTVTIRLQEGGDLATVPVNSDGCYTTNLSMPTDLEPGPNPLTATNENGSTSTTFNITRPVLNVLPSSGPSGSTVSADGCGWYAGETVSLFWQTTNPSQIGSATANSDGCWDASITIPLNQPSGVYTDTIRASGSLASGSRAVATFEIKEPELLFEPSVAARGETIIGYGCGWVGQSPVDLRWSDGSSLGTDDVSLSGCFDVEFEVPGDATVGPQTLNAWGSNGAIIPGIFEVDNSVTLNIAPPLVDVGENLVVNGLGYGDGEVVRFYWRDQQLDGVTVDVGGSWSTLLPLPTNAPAGTFTLRAEGDLGSTAVATTTVDSEAFLQILEENVFQNEPITFCLNDFSNGEWVSLNVERDGVSQYLRTVRFQSSPGAVCETEVAGLAQNDGIGLYNYTATGNLGHFATDTLTVVEDTRRPEVTVSHDPENPNDEEQVRISVEATDDNNLESIVIYLAGPNNSFSQQTVCSQSETPNWEFEPQRWRCQSDRTLLAPGNYVYIVTVKDVEGNLSTTGDRIRVIPKPQPKVDLRVGHMEITQGIQNENNDMDLIARKATTVRVFVEAWLEGNRVAQANVTGLLYGEIDGEPLPGSPLSPVESTMTVSADGWARNNYADALNFDLPRSWTEEERAVFRVELNPNETIDEGYTGNNSDQINARFWDTRPICVVTIPVRTVQGTPAGDFPRTQLGIDTFERALTLLPTYRIRPYWQTNPIEEWEFFSYGPYEFDNDETKIITAVWFRDQFSNDPAWCDQRGARTHYAGVISENEGSGNGLASLGKDQLWFVARSTDLDDGNGNGFNTPHGGRTLAHELGHNYGRRHVNCGGPEGVDNNYPYNPCALSFVGQNREYIAFDPISRIAFGPRDTINGQTFTGDLMSYSNRRWSSAYTWRAIFMQLIACRGGLCEVPPRPPNRTISDINAEFETIQEEEEILLLFGSIDPLTQTVTVDELLQAGPNDIPANKRERLLAANPPRSEAPIFTLQLVDVAGEVLVARPFSPGETADGPPQSFFALAIPDHPQAVELRVLYGNDLLYTESRSASPPTVTIVSPTQGAEIDAELTIEWEASDPDGDELTFIVQYSGDSGNTWTALGTDIRTNSLTVDTTALPGSDGQSRIRVLASDRFQSASATSAPFSLQKQAPIVTIDPLHKTTVPAGTTLLLRGDGFDMEDGVLPEADLNWTVTFPDGNQETTSGGERILSQLAPGSYTITLAADDSDGATGSDRLTIVVNPETTQPTDRQALFLPLVTNK